MANDVILADLPQKQRYLLRGEMLIEIEHLGEICVLRCKGYFVTGPDFDQVQARIEDVKKLNCSKVLVDFSEVLSLGSMGISFIVTVYQSVVRHSGGHFVVAGAIARVRKVLDLTRLSTVIPIAEDFASGLAVIYRGDAESAELHS